MLALIRTEHSQVLIPLLTAASVIIASMFEQGRLYPLLYLWAIAVLKCNVKFPLDSEQNIGCGVC